MTVEATKPPDAYRTGSAELSFAPRQHREYRLAELSQAVMTSIHALLGEIAAAMSDGGLVGDSVDDMRAWLIHNLGLSRATARHWVLVAERSPEMPETMRRLSTGEVSIDAAVIIARHGASDNEAELAELATDITTEELTRIAKDMRPPDDPDDIEEREFIKELHWFRDERNGWWWIDGRLPLADGIVVETALQRTMDRMQSKHFNGQWIRHDIRAAEALIELAGVNLDADRDPDRATVVVHITQPQMPEQPQLTVIENGPAIGIAPAHRISCDARCQEVFHDRRGVVIGVGRTTRVVPQWLRRVVRGRDHRCRFPACNRTRLLHIHHIRHWSKGGPTDLSNLITLCAHHHRLVHEYGWGLVGSADNPVFELAPGVPYEPIRRLHAKSPP